MIQRRDFLKAAGAACLIPSLGVAAQSKPTATDLKLGLVTYNWGRSWDVPTIIKNCEATRFAGVELRSTHQHGVEITIDQLRRKEVRQQFADSNVELVGLGSACEYHSDNPAVVAKNIEETKAFVKLCHDVGGSGVKVRPNGLPKSVPVEKTLEQIGHSLNLVGKFAEDYGVQIRVEVHGRETAEIPHMKTIMDHAEHRNVVVCWNCNPQDLEGPGLVHNYKLLQDRMGTVHIHDLRNDKYPWKTLIPLLKQTNVPSFSGWALLEEGDVPKDIVAAMLENADVWDSLIALS